MEKTIGGYNFLRDMTTSGPENLIRGYIRISEYHYLGTRKPNKRIYPAISEGGVRDFLADLFVSEPSQMSPSWPKKA